MLFDHVEDDDVVNGPGEAREQLRRGAAAQVENVESEEPNDFESSNF